MDKEIVYWMRVSTEIHAECSFREDVPDGAVIISEDAFLYLKKTESKNTDSIIRELIHAELDQDAKFQPTANEMRYP